MIVKYYSNFQDSWKKLTSETGQNSKNYLKIFQLINLINYLFNLRMYGWTILKFTVK